MPDKRLKRILVGGLLATTLLLPATVLRAEVGVGDGEVLVGMVNARSGPAAGLGQGMLVGADSVFKEVNAAGGVNGRKINLIVADDGYEPDRTVDETIAMIEKKQVFCLFGYVGTPTANAAIPIVAETKVPLVGLFTGAMTLRSPVTPEIVNIRASYDDEAEALVDYFITRGNAKSFGVFYQDDGFGQAVLSGTEKALKKRGLAVTATGLFQRNTVAVKTGLSKMLESRPDAIVMAGPYTPLAEFIKIAKTEGLKSRLATVSFVGTDNLVGMVGALGDGVVISQVVPFPGDASLPITKSCGELVGKHHPGEVLNFVSFEGCITAKVLVEGLQAAGRELRREGLLRALEQLSGRDLGGITVTLGPGDHQALDVVFLTEIRGGRIAKLER